MKISPCICSGVKNQEKELSEDEAEQVRNLINNLTEKVLSFPAPRLGYYSGFVVEIFEDPIECLFVQEGVVSLYKIGKSPEYFADIGIENFLIFIFWK